LGAAFTPRVVEGMRARIQEIVDALINALEPRTLVGGMGLQVDAIA
jgi:cytochrome P450